MQEFSATWHRIIINPKTRFPFLVDQFKLMNTLNVKSNLPVQELTLNICVRPRIDS